MTGFIGLVPNVLEVIAIKRYMGNAPSFSGTKQHNSPAVSSMAERTDTGSEPCEEAATYPEPDYVPNYPWLGGRTDLDEQLESSYEGIPDPVRLRHVKSPVRVDNSERRSEVLAHAFDNDADSPDPSGRGPVGSRVLHGESDKDSCEESDV